MTSMCKAGGARSVEADKRRIKGALKQLVADHGAHAALSLLSGQLVSLVGAIAEVKGEDPDKEIVLEAYGFRKVTIHAMGDSK